MSDIRTNTQVVFHAPTRGRSYLTARAAAKAEADAMLVRKYPTEKPEYDSSDGMCYDLGYHWSGDERLVRVHARLTKRLLVAVRAAASLPSKNEGKEAS